MTEHRTAFDPSTHGFHFRNRFSGLDILGEIDDGLGDVAAKVSGSADVWKVWGLCGGMTWHALDRYYAKNPVPATTQIPGADSSVFRTLVFRQFDSFHGASLIKQCLRWQSRNDTRQWWDFRRTIRKLTLIEYYRVKESIDRGFPASLTLIRTTLDPSKNHQVLAVSYREDEAAGSGEIGLYDPNHPDEEPTLTTQLGGSDAGKAAQSTNERLRGFFVWPYDRTRRVMGAGQ